MIPSMEGAFFVKMLFVKAGTAGVSGSAWGFFLKWGSKIISSCSDSGQVRKKEGESKSGQGKRLILGQCSHFLFICWWLQGIYSLCEFHL